MQSFKLIRVIAAVLTLIFLLVSCRGKPGDDLSGNEVPSTVTSEELGAATAEVGSDDSAAETGSYSDGDVLRPQSTGSRTSTGASGTSSKGEERPQVVGNELIIDTPQEKKFESLRGKTLRITSAGGEDLSVLDSPRKALLNLIQRKYGVKIEFEVFSSPEEEQTRLPQMVAAGNPPDICQINAPIFLRYVYSNTLQPLDANVVSDPGWTKDSLEAYKLNNKIYAIPIRYDIPEYFVYFNKTLFKEEKVKTPYEHYKAGTWNFTNFVDTAKRMTLKLQDGVTIKTRGVGTWNYAALMLANGGSGLSQAGSGKFTVTIDKEKEMGGLQALYELAAADAFYTGDSYAGFSQRRIAMFIERPWNGIAQWDYYNRMEDEFGIAPLPVASDGKYYAPVELNGVGIPRNAKNPLAGLMYCYENYKFFDSRVLNAKSGPDLEDRRAMMSDEHLEFYREYMKKAVPIRSYMEGLAGWWGVGAFRDQFWNNIMVDKKTPSVAVDSMKGILETALKRTTG